MNLYEHTIVARQDTSPAQVKQLTEKYSKIVEKNDGEIVQTEEWPTPGAIYALARDAIPRPKLVRQPLPPEPVKERCDPKTAQEICEAAGFTPKRFGGEA